MNYVVVSPHRLSGWQVASRRASLVSITRLRAPIADPEAARAEAQTLYPDHHTYVVGDTYKPWENAA